MDRTHYFVTDIANIYKLDVRVVLKTIKELGLKVPLSLEEAKAVRAAIPESAAKTEVVRAAARPEAKTEIERLLDKLPEWVVTALIAVYERAYTDGQRAAIANLNEGIKI